MSERWTSPKAGPFPSGHLVTLHTDDGSFAEVTTRCGRIQFARSQEEVAAFSSEPPPTSEGRTCETCLRLANRDHRAGSGEGDASTQPVEVIP